MRLIDAHKVQLKLFEECQNIRHFDKDRKKKQIFADGIDFAWVMLDNTPTVEAIPIEWLRTWFTKNGYLSGIALVDKIESDWEKENEQNKESTSQAD